MLKILGLLCVVGSASAVGFGFAAGVRRQAEQLRALQTALGQMKNETAYRMTPLPELLAQAGAQTEGAVGAVFSRCAAELRRRTSTVQFAMQTALSHTPGLALPQSAQRALLALSASLGKFDVDGQCRAIDLAASRVGEALEDVEQASRARCRSYRTLGVCAGLAIAVILL